MNQFKTALLGTAAIAVAAGFAIAPASAQTADPSAAAKVVASGSDKIKLTLSGQVHRNSVIVDDGFDTEVKHVDNQLTGSRFRIGGSGKINSDVSVGTMIEMGIIPNSSGATTQDATNSNSGAAGTHEARVVDIFVTHGMFGRVYMGKGAAGSDGSGEVTKGIQGNVSLQTGDMTHVPGGGFLFKNVGVDTGGAGRGAITLGTALADYDGNSRVNRVRYDTPTLMGFQARATHADQGDWDVSLFHDATYFGFSVGAGLAYNEAPNSTTRDSLINGSVSVMSPWGISLGAAAGRAEIEGANRTTGYWGATVAYDTKFNELGKSSIGYTYTSHRGDAGTDTSATGHQVSIMQQIDAAAMDLYLTYARASLDVDSAGVGSGGSYKDIDAFMMGTRVRF